MKTPTITSPAAHQDRFLRAFESNTDRRHAKWAEGTTCAACGAAFVGGRWIWTEAPQTGPQTTCDACTRIEANTPAGELRLEGAFLADHQDEIMGLIRNEADAEGADHPLNRLMGVVEADGALVVTTTDIHLPRRIGHALERAYQGELALDYQAAEEIVRAVWHRD
ncbi:MAG: ATPase [Geminicoccaceae bacterium]|nr:MAG: ATPase [Geminicoccaceae bacterium]